jgi:hypothetical protein
MSEAMEKRGSERFDKVFPVWVESGEFGECLGVARNISAGGMFVEMAEPLPLGSRIKVHFAIPEARGTLIATGEVKRHYFLQFSDRLGPRVLTGMGIRFTAFEDDSDARLASGLEVWKSRVLH